MPSSASALLSSSFFFSHPWVQWKLSSWNETKKKKAKKQKIKQNKRKGLNWTFWALRRCTLTDWWLTAGWLTAGQSLSHSHRPLLVERWAAMIGFACLGSRSADGWDETSGVAWCECESKAVKACTKRFLIGVPVLKGKKVGRGDGPRWIISKVSLHTDPRNVQN